ncbi:MAG: hypothetical protein EA425_03810 [Puniceicoccaceae bacterium]|nr:MAG: hypothetical protein EA425_03810 [Puniceicoccaceae bacterium]
MKAICMRTSGGEAGRGFVARRGRLVPGLRVVSPRVCFAIHWLVPPGLAAVLLLVPLAVAFWSWPGLALIAMVLAFAYVIAGETARGGSDPGRPIGFQRRRIQESKTGWIAQAEAGGSAGKPWGGDRP